MLLSGYELRFSYLRQNGMSYNLVILQMVTSSIGEVLYGDGFLFNR